MKFLIYWFAFGFYGFITVYLKKLGITLGAIPTVVIAGACYFVAKKLCKVWDQHRRRMDIAAIDSKASAAGKSRREYLIEHTPGFIIDICEGNHSAESIVEMLRPHIKAGVITLQMVNALSEEFGTK